MKLLSLKMPDALVEGMDELVRRRLYPSRSAVIRVCCTRPSEEGVVV
jgi:antitoxin ParD1/3/4